MFLRASIKMIFKSFFDLQFLALSILSSLKNYIDSGSLCFLWITNLMASPNKSIEIPTLPQSITTDPPASTTSISVSTITSRSTMSSRNQTFQLFLFPKTTCQTVRRTKQTPRSKFIPPITTLSRVSRMIWWSRCKWKSKS